MPLVLGAAENAALFRLNLVQQQVWCKIYSFPQRPAPLIISYASIEVMHLGTVKDVGASRVQFRQFRVRPDFLAQTVADHSTCSASFFCLSLFF